MLLAASRPHRLRFGDGRRGRTRPARIVPVAALAGLLLVAGQLPTWGHSGGELPNMRWSADGEVVTGTWTGPPDDAAWIGESIGVLRDGAMDAYLGGPLDAYPTEDEIVTFSRSSELEAYLHERVQVRQNGVACEGQVTPADDFIADGADFRFSCPEEVRTVDIRITILHEKDPAFRTFSGDGTVQSALHTADAPEHAWDFTLVASDDEGGGLLSAAAAAFTTGQAPVILTLVVGAGVVLAGVVGSLRLAGRDRRR